MTVENTNYTQSFSGNGSTQTFSVTDYEILTEDDFTAVLIDSDGRRTAQTKTTHYTITMTNPNDLPTVFDVVMVTAPASGETLEVRRTRSLQQGTAFPASGKFPSDSAEQMGDSVAMGNIDDQHAEVKRGATGHAKLTLADNGATITLSSEEVGYPYYEVTGSPGAARDFVFPASAEHMAWILNSFADSSPLTVKAAGAGTSVSLAALGKGLFYSDGTDVEQVDA